MRSIATHVARSVVCMSVCLLRVEHGAKPAKTGEPIAMRLGQTHVGGAQGPVLSRGCTFASPSEYH